MQTPARGVYQDEIAPAGERWYKVVTSNGKVGVVRLPVELVDDSLVSNLLRRLDKMDPERQLRIV